MGAYAGFRSGSRLNPQPSRCSVKSVKSTHHDNVEKKTKSFIEKISDTAGRPSVLKLKFENIIDGFSYAICLVPAYSNHESSLTVNKRKLKISGLLQKVYISRLHIH